MAHESRLDGQPVVPIQAVTSAVYLTVGLISLYLWFSGFFGTLLLLALTVTQGWRAVSEIVRADYRRGGKIPAYQKMAILTIVYGVFIMFLFPVREAVTPVLAHGAASLWNPLMLF